jgi:hypothetical protein
VLRSASRWTGRKGVEKPFSTDAISGKELVRAADECDAKLLVGHHRRFEKLFCACNVGILESRHQYVASRARSGEKSWLTKVLSARVWTCPVSSPLTLKFTDRGIAVLAVQGIWAEPSAVEKLFCACNVGILESRHQYVASRARSGEKRTRYFLLGCGPVLYPVHSH